MVFIDESRWRIITSYIISRLLFIGNTSISALSLLPQIAEQPATSKQITHPQPLLRKSIKLTNGALVHLLPCSILNLHAGVAETGIATVIVLLLLLDFQRHDFLPAGDKDKSGHESHHTFLKLQSNLFGLEVKRTLTLLSIDLLLDEVILDFLAQQHVGEDVRVSILIWQVLQVDVVEGTGGDEGLPRKSH